MRAPMMRIHTVAAGGGSILHFDARPLPRRPGFGRRQSRPRLLPPRRAAHRHRRQRHARQAAARLLPGDLRPRRRPAARRGRRAREVRRPRRRDRRRPHAGGDRRRLPAPSPSRTWPTPSRRSPSSAATTSPTTCSTASAAPAASMPAWSPTRSAWQTVLIHPFSGLLSAYGMGLAGVFASRQQALSSSRSPKSIAAEIRRSWSTRSATPVFAELTAQGVPERRRVLASDRCICATTAPIRRCRSTIAGCSARCMRARRSRRAPQAQFGFVFADKPIVVETVEVAGTGRRASPAATSPTGRLPPSTPSAGERRTLFSGGAWHDAGDLPPRGAEARPQRSPARR